MTQNITHIEATNLPDLWHQTLYRAVEVGRDFTIDHGSFAGQVRKEFDFVVLRSKCPWSGELLPKLNPALNLDDPCAQDFLDDYMPYLMTGEEKEGEAYTYGQRMDAVAVTNLLGKWKTYSGRQIYIQDEDIWEMAFNTEKKGPLYRGEGVTLLSQIELMIWTYRNKGYRNNQMVLQVGQPEDMMLQDPPCLRHIDTRIQDGKLHFYPYFRSWDLWGGLPANLAAIETLRQYCASAIGLETVEGEIIATSKGLHLYNYVWEIAEIVRGKTSEEFKQKINFVKATRIKGE